MYDLRDFLTEGGDALGDEAGCVDVAVCAFGGTRLQDLAQRRARLHLLWIERVHLGKAPIGENHALLGIEQAQALRHVVDGCIEARVLGLELLLALFQQLVLAPELVVGGLELGQRPVERAERQKGEREIGGDRQDQSKEPDAGDLLQQRAQAGGYLGGADQGAGGEYRRPPGKRRPGKPIPLLHHRGALRVEDALHDGSRSGGADLAHGRQLVGVVFPGRIRGVDVLRRPRCRQLRLVGERFGFLEVADTAIADGN